MIQRWRALIAWRPWTFGVWLVVACSPVHKGGVQTAMDGRELKAMIADPEKLDYPMVQRLVLADSCVRCHNPKDKKDGVDLSTYEQIGAGVGSRVLVEPFQPGESALYSVLIAKGKRHMPPLDEPQLSSDQITAIYLWIENGAKLNAKVNTTRPPSLKEKLAPYFAQPELIDYPIVRQYVLGTSCLKCHSLQGESPDRDAIAYSANLTTYKSLFNAFVTVVSKGDPETSPLYTAAAVTQSMPPPKEGYDPLDSLRLKLLRLWILNCAIENKAALGDEVLQPDPENPNKVRACEAPVEPSPPAGAGGDRRGHKLSL